MAFGHVSLNYQDFVTPDPKYFRPAEVDLLVGNPARARQALGWEPSMTFQKLVEMMVEADLEALRSGREV